ncbi:MAG: pimeloyl-ACP methyl ester carboxylesterase [Kiritimatiellia bacterium]
MLNYLSNARHSVLFWLALGLILALAIPLSLLAQQNNTVPASASLEVKTLGSIDYVEINTPSASAQPKQLIIFVHGTPGSYTAFRSYLNDPVMQEKFHMISVTRPGWRNDEDTKVPSLDDQAAALRPLLDMDRSGKGALLMGHSYGGPVIARTAMNYSELIAGLIFVATTGDPELSAPRWYNRFAVALPRFVLGASLKGANAEIMPLRPQLEAMVPRWQDITMPVLIVQGDKDRLVHPGNALFMQRMLINSEVRYLHREGLGHFVLWEEAPLIRDNLIELFASRSDP